MSRQRILISWVGHNDLRAMCAALPAEQGKKLLAEIGGKMPPAAETGPIKTLLDSEKFDAVYLLSDYEAAWSRRFAKWLASSPSCETPRRIGSRGEGPRQPRRLASRRISRRTTFS